MPERFVIVRFVPLLESVISLNPSLAFPTIVPVKNSCGEDGVVPVGKADSSTSPSSAVT